LLEHFPDAFSAIMDSCQTIEGLQFYFVRDNLYCAPYPEKASVLGDWEAYYDCSVKKWVIVPLGIM
jgi:hypothetical protein